MIEKINTLIKSDTFKQLVKYGVVGGIGLLVELCVFALLVKVFDVHFPFSQTISDMVEGKISIATMDKSISHVISSVIAIINNFILNSYFTFKVTDHKIKRFLNFFCIATIGLVISTSLFTLFISVLHLDEMLAKIGAVLIVATLQFGVNKMFTFRE